jgi:hypothetical protein
MASISKEECSQGCIKEVKNRAILFEYPLSNHCGYFCPSGMRLTNLFTHEIKTFLFVRGMLDACHCFNGSVTDAEKKLKNNQYDTLGDGRKRFFAFNLLQTSLTKMGRPARNLLPSTVSSVPLPTTNRANRHGTIHSIWLRDPETVNKSL